MRAVLRSLGRATMSDLLQDQLQTGLLTGCLSKDAGNVGNSGQHLIEASAGESKALESRLLPRHSAQSMILLPTRSLA